MIPTRPLERVSAEDMMSLDADAGSAPMQVGAILMLRAGAGQDPAPLLDMLARRISTVPRLRQRLVPVPFGCGRPVWVTDSTFDMADHLGAITCPDAGGEESVLKIAAAMLAAPLPLDRPLWTAKLITGVGEDHSAFVFVFHHVLTDGIGGLAVLEALATETEPQDRQEPPAVPSSKSSLALDAARTRLHAVARLPKALRTAAAGALALKPSRAPRAARTSLNCPTGRQRQLALVRCDLETVKTAARSHGATVNDLVLAAASAALHGLLQGRGETLEEFVISVLFSGRRHTTASSLGNRNGVIPVPVPAVGPAGTRLAAVAAATRALKQHPPGASTAILGPLSRLLARLGAYRYFIDHQRLVHTFVTNLHGPEHPLVLSGVPVTGIIPLGAISGNVTLAFAALSYAGTLTITAIADPQTCPDLAKLSKELDRAIKVLIAAED
jgi:WS/DGAT/MGAT family acyltransferase